MPLARNENALARRLQPSMAERTRLGLFLLTGSCIIPLISDALGSASPSPTLLILESVRVAFFTALTLYLHPARSARSARIVIFLGGVAMAATTSWIALLRGDLGPYLIVTGSLALGSAVVLPWTPQWQLAIALVFSAGMAGAFIAGAGSGTALASGASMFAYLMSLLTSVLVASLDQQRRRAIAEALDQTLRTGEALRELNDSLEQRVEERTRALADANRALATKNRDLEATYRELEDFTHSVSHDLRVPLRVIHGLSRLTLDGYGEALGEEGCGFVRRIGEAAIGLGEIGDDLLTLARVTRAPIAFEDVDLSAMARDVIADLRRSTQARAVEVVVADGLRAHGEPHLLRIVVAQLLENAWKFTRQREDARIEVGPYHCDGQAGFSISDNGSGFAPEFAGKLFQPFERVHDDASLEGRGVGLAIAKRIVSRHGGRIDAQGEHGRGATFRVTFPPAEGVL